MFLRPMTILLASIASSAGCGSSLPPPPPAPTLVISIDGSPAIGLQVLLTAADGKGVASGTTDASGKAVVRAGDGTAPGAGRYKVVLADTGDVEENPMEVVKKAAKSRIPSAYAKAATTKAGVIIDDASGSYPVDIQSK